MSWVTVVMGAGMSCEIGPSRESLETERALERIIGVCGICTRHCLGSETMDNCGIELVSVGEMEIKAAMGPELFGAQWALVEAVLEVEENVELKVMATGSGKGTVRTAEM